MTARSSRQPRNAPAALDKASVALSSGGGNSAALPRNAAAAGPSQMPCDLSIRPSELRTPRRSSATRCTDVYIDSTDSGVPGAGSKPRAGKLVDALTGARVYRVRR